MGFIRTATVIAAALAGYRALVRGDLTLDLGVGRRTRPLGCPPVDIAASREAVFDLIAEPYVGRTTRALRDKLEVVERGSDMVLAAHRTPVSGGLVTTTLETVRFERPERIHFRLVRGPVPFVVRAVRADRVRVRHAAGACRRDGHRGRAARLKSRLTSGETLSTDRAQGLADVVRMA